MRVVLVVLLVSAPLWGQGSDPLDAYIGDLDVGSDGDISNLLPGARPQSFATYVIDTSEPEVPFSEMLNLVESLRLNKLVGAAAGGTGSTSLVSSVSVPAVIGFGLERGGILQANNATVTTFRGNALGLAKLAVGAEQFPYCPEVDSRNCSVWSRRLRLLSGMIAFQNTSNPVEVPGSTEALFGEEYRMSAWGVRLDLTPSNNLDDPKYVADWSERIESLRGRGEVSALSEAVEALFGRKR